jgi:excisionase family DNA binding protein
MSKKFHATPLSNAERERRRQQRLASLQQVPRRGYSVDEWCAAHGRSRDTAYKLMRAGKLRYVDLGGRRFIPNEAADELLAPARLSSG